MGTSAAEISWWADDSTQAGIGFSNSIFGNFNNVYPVITDYNIQALYHNLDWSLAEQVSKSTTTYYGEERELTQFETYQNFSEYYLHVYTDIYSSGVLNADYEFVTDLHAWSPPLGSSLQISGIYYSEEYWQEYWPTREENDPEFSDALRNRRMLETASEDVFWKLWGMGKTFSGDDHFSIAGDAVHNYIYPGIGKNSVNAGKGIETVEYYWPRDHYVVNVFGDPPSRGGNGLVEVLGDVQEDHLWDVEFLLFGDGTLLELEDFDEWWGWQKLPGDSIWSTSYETSRDTNNIWRFFNIRDKAFFYTASREEAQMILMKSRTKYPDLTHFWDTENKTEEEKAWIKDDEKWPYFFQGTTFAEATRWPEKTAPLYRFYNYQTGHHFFTVSEEERDMVLEKADSGEWPFNYEGVAFRVYPADPDPGAPAWSIPEKRAVHRLYSPSLNRHVFTADTAERGKFQRMMVWDENGNGAKLWNYEGIGFWADNACYGYADSGFPYDGDC